MPAAADPTQDAQPRPTLARRVFIAPVRWYQMARADRPSPCRHVPSCSTYAIEAVEMHGPLRGLWLGARRIIRCNPWGTSGYDPVPERKAN
ncbi:MAG: membrane protein insertion efficiency factor YidD [Actinomycetia bacterium]|nr:membrane protein insertion efficiency factor YidD [Actinomycetes bacterium]